MPRGLHGGKLAFAIGASFVLGALMMLGVGLYAPCLILVSLLGMNPLVAFPIMMGSCAFLMPVGGARFVASGRYSLRAALGLAIGGIPAVLIAAYLVKSLPLDWLRWLVIVVATYAAISMLWSARRDAAPDAA
ncbi:TSUP family transporter [Sphingopyxis macrogoltabida]|uniref:TSUP family transporter n=1 Tax=Sphingopyxis macrogoltabida TaxID=33050 RepID=UPI000A7FEA84|nr:TSUP family transporter [Sphingopyxis macrogoltabida]